MCNSFCEFYFVTYRLHTIDFAAVSFRGLCTKSLHHLWSCEATNGDTHTHTHRCNAQVHSGDYIRVYTWSALAPINLAPNVRRPSILDECGVSTCAHSSHPIARRAWSVWHRNAFTAPRRRVSLHLTDSWSKDGNGGILLVWSPRPTLTAHKFTSWSPPTHVWGPHHVQLQRLLGRIWFVHVFTLSLGI